MKKQYSFLSYPIDVNSPTYGNRDKVILEKKSSISNGDAANNTFFSSTTHVGTHLDMPYHFHDNGQTIEDFDADFWFFQHPTIIELTPKNKVIDEELSDILSNIKINKNCDILIVKTGSCYTRDHLSYRTENFGFSPNLYNKILKVFPNLKVFGFDSISISSFTNRLLGRESHKVFLNPSRPIILLEDMDLRYIHSDNNFQEIIVSPIRLKNSDGIPCTVFAVK